MSTTTTTNAPGFFSFSLNGQIESAHIPNTDNLYCKYSIVQGHDWALISGLEEGISQIARAPTASTFTATQSVKPCVWNFPLEATFKSTNVYGWPQLVVSVYGLDELGRDVVRGYGSIRLPRTSGIHTLYIPLFTPVATSPLNGLLSWIAGRLPEFLDPKFTSKSQGREVTRVKSNGSVKIRVNIVLNNTEKHGYRGCQ